MRRSRRRFNAGVAITTGFMIVGAALSPALAQTGTPPQAPGIAGYAVDVSDFGGTFGFWPQAVLSIPSVRIVDGAAYRPSMKPGTGRTVEVERVRVPVEAAITAIQAMYEAAVEPAGGFGGIPVYDAPTTRITVRTPEGERQVWVYVPGYDPVDLEAMVGTERAEARRKVAAALEQLWALNGPTSTYRPKEFEMWELRRSAPTANDTKNAVRVRKNPVPTPVEGCSVLRSSSLPSKAGTNVWFRLPNGKVTVGLLRPVLPGEQPCLRTKTGR
jgi:hypothetical protein